MPNIKQIITPDNTTYDIKDSAAVSNIIYNTTNSPALQKTINDTTTTIEVPDMTPTSGSKHLITSGAVYSTVGDINTILEHIIDGTTLIEKSITQNGTYTASDDEADGYSSVAVNVPNTYTQADEGKVVSNGALVAQGSDTVIENGTVDTTLISSLLVNVAGSGASALKLISDQNVIVNDCYIFEGEQYIYIFGYVQQEKSSLASLIIPQEFNINLIGAKVMHVWHSISSSTELNNFNSFTFDAELRKITFRSTSSPSSSVYTKYMLIVTFEKNSV